MVQVIQDILADTELFVESVEHADKDVKGYSIGISWKPCLKCNYSEPAGDGDVFLYLLYRWLEVQKEHKWLHPSDRQERSSVTLFTELFGTSIFSDLEVTKLTDPEVFQTIERCMISDHDNEKNRQREIKSMKHAVGVVIKCTSGDILYFGKTTSFYFLVSDQYLNRAVISVGKNIKDILFGGNRNESARKRPEMYIGSLDQMGLYRMFFGVVEDLLKDAVEKEISIRLLPQSTVEIICAGYSVSNNTCGMNEMSVVSALSEFFDYQDSGQTLRTEKGILIGTDYTSPVIEGIKIVWRPDITIFGCIDLDYYVVLNRMIELASLYPYKVCLSDCNNRNIVHIPSGIGALLNEDYFGLSPSKTIPIEISDREFSGRAAVSFSRISGETQKSYVNGHITQDGGVHAEGVVKGTRKALKRILALYDNSLTPDNILKSLNYVINIQTDKPRYQGAIRGKFKNIEVGLPVRKQVERQVYEYLLEDIAPLRSIFYSNFDDSKRVADQKTAIGG